LYVKDISRAYHIILLLSKSSEPYARRSPCKST
jgi:hypothetical protein